MHSYDYIIAGSGLAGLYAAFCASRYGKVAVITRTKVSDSNTYYAQGGIAAVTDEEDTPKFHFEDTIIAGRGLCNKEAVEILVNEGPERIKEIIEEGMHFDMSGGSLALGLEGGHSMRRVLHAGGDITGRRITEFMIDKIRSNENITLFENHRALEIIKDGNRSVGLRVWNYLISREELFFGKNTILALGGASAIYQRTTNPPNTLGDGVALAYNAGCEIADMEFIQFHPTTIYSKNDKSYLISEAVRGEGAWLINTKGQRFMTAIHPMAELAPRDVVAQAIFKEIQNCSAVRDRDMPPCVYLTLSHLDPEKIKSRFPHIYQKCAELGIDMTDRIPVAPAAHYMVGGVKTDLNGKTSIDNLYVCGELASTGLMGANRLASNSLAECLVFGYRAVEHSSKQKESGETGDLFNRCASIKRFYKDERGAALYDSIKERIAAIMMQSAGIVRERESLESGLNELSAIEQQIDLYSAALDGGDKEYYLYTSRFLIITARLIMTGALTRKESRGGHYRNDYPKESTNLYHTIQIKDKPVKLKPMSINPHIQKIIELSLEEDIASGDITTNSIINYESRATAQLTSKADGIISGIEIAKLVFGYLDSDILFKPFVEEGEKIVPGQKLIEIEGSYRTLLTAERTALNILQRMSGIATATAKFVKQTEGTHTRILDTRKTSPGMRLLDKMAVKAGGGENHRIGLYDMALIKDNHIKVAGGITNAVEQVKAATGGSVKIEVETTTLEEVAEAIKNHVDIIMLDNMDLRTMRAAVLLIGDKAKTEASGNMTLDRIAEVASCGVDYISVGALTHSVTALDISMNIVRAD